MSYPTFVSKHKISMMPATAKSALVHVLGPLLFGKLVGTPVYVSAIAEEKSFAALCNRGNTHVVIPPIVGGDIAMLLHELFHVAHWYLDPEGTINAASTHPARMEVVVFFCLHRLVARAYSPFVKAYLDEIDLPDSVQRTNSRFGKLAHEMYPFEATSRIIKQILAGTLELR